MRRSACVRRNPPGSKMFRGRVGYYIWFPKPDGKCGRRWGGELKRDAQAKLDKMIASGEITAPTPETITLEQFVPMYLKHKAVVLGRKPSTIVGDRNRLTGAILPELGEFQLASITANTVSKYLQERRRTVSVATANRERALLSHIFTVARTLLKGYAAEHPIRGKIPAPIERTSRHNEALTELDQVRLLDACRVVDTGIKRPYLWLMCLVSLDTGARPGRQTLTLRWTDIDHEAGMIRFKNTKSGDHAVPATARLLAALRERQAASTSSYVFPGKGGTRPLVKYFGRFRQAADRAGLSRTTIAYHLRHTFATNLLMRGVPIQVVKRLLGHSTVLMTERYSHSSDAAERAASDLAGSIGSTHEERSDEREADG